MDSSCIMARWTRERFTRREHRSVATMISLNVLLRVHAHSYIRIQNSCMRSSRVVSCGLFSLQGTRESLLRDAGGKKEREKEQARCSVRDTFMAQSTVYSNIVTPPYRSYQQLHSLILLYYIRICILYYARVYLVACGSWLVLHPLFRNDCMRIEFRSRQNSFQILGSGPGSYIFH